MKAPTVMSPLKTAEKPKPKHERRSERRRSVWTPRVNTVWRTVSLTRSSTARLALVSEALELVRLAPERDDHPQHAIASFTIESDCHSSPWTTLSRGTIRVP